MFNSYLLLISILVLAGFSGQNKAIENISLLVTIILVIATFLGMFIKNEPPPKANEAIKYIGKCGWFIAILFYASYGLWIQCIAMILTIVFIKNSGAYYRTS